jgi:serine/threonine protein kinase
MKCLNGETLASRLSQGPLSAAEALRIARGIASGVNALHAEGIVHCDLKPGNIMLDAASGGAATPVIVDFGLATRATAGPAKAVSGSPQYMAPEQFRLAPVSPAVDVYAFGLILFEMIAGTRPFPAEELLPAAIRRAVEAAPRLRSLAPWAPVAWDEAIALALSRVPSERPRSAGEVLDMMTRAASPSASIHMLRPERSCSHSGRHGRPRRSLTT